MRVFVFVIILACLIQGACNEQESFSDNTSLDRETIEQHLDTTATVYGRYSVVKLPIQSGVDIRNPFQLTKGPNGVIYAANQSGEIYTLVDTDGDGLEDHAELFCDISEQGLRTPTSMIFKGDELYVGTASEIHIFKDTDGDGKADSSRTFFDKFPSSEHPYDYTSGLTFDTEGNLYFSLTTDSWNAGAAPDPMGLRGALLKVSPDGNSFERYATGLRSVPTMAFNNYGDLVFIDNQGSGNLTEEINLAQEGNFYGHNPSKYGEPESTEPIHDLQLELAPSGMVQNSIDNNFDDSAGDFFVSFYGPGEHWDRGGISRVKFTKSSTGEYGVEEIPVANGLAKLSDLEFGNNGDLYVAQVGKTDYWYQPLEEPDGSFYRLIYSPWVEPEPVTEIKKEGPLATPSETERGEYLFQLACNACHATDGVTELLGPNLRNVGHRFSLEELKGKINDPSASITPGMRATRIILRDSTVYLGRVTSTSDQEIQMILVGNQTIQIDRSQVVSQESYERSLMTTDGLIDYLEEEDVNALLSYVMNLYREVDSTEGE